MQLGIDVGTTGTKAMLVEDDGRRVYSSYQGYDLISERPGEVEQSPEDWWKALVYTVRDCVAHAPDPGAIRAMCLSVQSGTLVPVAGDGRPSMNAISWLDTRASKTCQALNREYGEEYFYNHTGWRLSGCFNFAQICHMGREDREAFDATRWFMSVADYLAFRLTGEIVTDENSIGNAQLGNVKAGGWDDDILRIAGIDRTRVADIVPCGTVIGTLTPRAAEELSLDRGVKVVSGAQDQYCSAIGIGAFNNGDVMFSTGTSWVLVGVSDRIVYDTAHYLTLGRHVIPGLYTSFAYTPAGGAALKWYRNCMGRPSGGSGGLESFDDISARAGRVEPGANGLFFLPHLGGTLYPTWSTKSRGILWGLDFAHNEDHIARALMEGVAFDLAWMLESMRAAGYDTHTLKCLGGSTRSDVWMQIVADMTGMEMSVSDLPDMAPMGAAMMAMVGMGVYGNYQEAFKGMNLKMRRFAPDAGRHERYLELLSRYKRLFEGQQALLGEAYH